MAMDVDSIDERRGKIGHWITQMDDRYDLAGAIGMVRWRMIVSRWISGGQIQWSLG